MRPSILISLVASAGLAGLAVACSAEEVEEDVDNGALVNGQTSGTEDDHVVLLVRQGRPLCTATLVAPNLLLTAQHCVAYQQGSTVSTTFQPAEISVRMGGVPSARPVAVATKIFTPRASGQDVGYDAARNLASMDIAAILVQPLDPTFERIRPRNMRNTPVLATDSVKVVGWNANGQNVQIESLRRLQRADVDVLADGQQPQTVPSPSDDAQVTTSKPREFVTEAVACQGDDGAPAFDTQGNVAGIMAAVVGPCVAAAGSLSIFTDVGAHASFVQGVIAEIGRLQCTSDARCGGGMVCDNASFTCTQGCRLGSIACASGAYCSAPGDIPGVVGTCAMGTSNNPTYYDYDASYGYGYDAGPSYGYGDGASTLPSQTQTDGGSTTTGGSCRDSSCGGTTTAPKVCDGKTQQCVAGCRVGASPSMCGAGSICTAGTADPTVGTCAASNVTVPAAPNLTPPSRPTESEVGEGSGLSPTDSNGDGGAKGKAAKAKADEGGCSASPQVGHVALRGIATWFGLGAIIALVTRRRRSASRNH